MDISTNIYPYQRISDEEFYFSTKRDIKYDVYFSKRDGIPIDRIQQLYIPELQVFEFGFDRYYEKKSIYDDKIFRTLVYIFTAYPKKDKLLYSYVFNPTGKNRELSKLYELVIKHVDIPHIRAVTVFIQTNTDQYTYYVYYDDRLNISFENFVTELTNIVKYVFSDKTVLKIKITDTMSDQPLFEE